MADPAYGSPLWVSGQGGPALTTKTRVTLGDGLTEATEVPHGGPSGATPAYVVCQPVTAATDGFFVGPISIEYDTTDDEVDIVFSSAGDPDASEAGDGDVAGAVFDVFVFFNDVA